MIDVPVVLLTPQEHVEKHAFNTDDGSTRYGSILASSYDGKIVNVEYAYEITLLYKASFDNDTGASKIYLPVELSVCPNAPNPNI